MSRQPTRLALAVAMAVLVALLGAGQALATPAPPDERALERQGRIDQQPAAEQPSQGSPAETPRRRFRPEPPPPVGPLPQLGGEQVAPAPTTAAPAGGRGGLVAIVAAALLLAVGGATTWRVRHRRPQPQSTI